MQIREIHGAQWDIVVLAATAPHVPRDDAVPFAYWANLAREVAFLDCAILDGRCSVGDLDYSIARGYMLVVVRL